MVRTFIQIVLPLVAPLALYALWVWYARRRAAVVGDEPPPFTKGAMFWSIVAGCVLVVISLSLLALSTGEEPTERRYVPPRMEGGKVLPPEFEPGKPPEEPNPYELRRKGPGAVGGTGE